MLSSNSSTLCRKINYSNFFFKQKTAQVAALTEMTMTNDKIESANFNI